METADFLVIGGGIAGAGAAAFLAPVGRTIVLEREEAPGYHTTGRSAALFHASYGPPVIRALARASWPFLETPPEGFSEAPLIAPRGAVTFAPPGAEARLEAFFAEIAEGAPEAALLDRAETLARAPVLRPQAVGAAIWEPAVVDLDVHAILAGYLRRLSAAGGRLVTGAEVTAITRMRRSWRVATNAGDFAAPVVVNAAGAWADVIAERAGIAPIGLVPKRRTAVTFDPPDGLDVRGLPLIGDLDDTFYLRPEGGGLMASPSDETPSPPCDARPEELDIAITLDRLARMTTLAPRRIGHARAGLRSFVADGAPVVGMAEDGFFWLAGQGGYGIETSPALSRTAAALVIGAGVPADIAACGVTAAALSPARLTG